MKPEGKWFWITYMEPFRIVTTNGVVPEVTLDEVNQCTYNRRMLSEIVGTIDTVYCDKGLKCLVCGDGALAIEAGLDSYSTNDLLLIYNNLLCAFLLGGIYVEAIDNRDITDGSLYKSNIIWPVNFGESLCSNTHARLRLKVANNMDSIVLDGASKSSKSIQEIQVAFANGQEILNLIDNLSPYYLIHGVTEMFHRNWSSATSSLWINAEQITDYLWLNVFLKDPDKNPNIPQRVKTMQQDHRTYSASVKQEILYQVGILPESVYAKIFMVRKARNKLVHEGKMVSKEDAVQLYNGIDELLRIAAGNQNQRLLPQLPDRWLNK